MEESVHDEKVERRASGNAKAKLAKLAFIANDGPQHQKHPCLIEAISSSRLIPNTFQACHFDKAKPQGRDFNDSAHISMISMISY